MRLTDRILGGFMSPQDAIIEGFFGVIMALDVSNFMRLALFGQDEKAIIFALSVAIFGCNLAWGMADALVNSLSYYYDETRRYVFALKLRGANCDEEAAKEACKALEEAMTDVESDILDAQGKEVMAREIARCARAKEPRKPEMRRAILTISGVTIFMNVAAGLPIIGAYLLDSVIGINACTLLANIIGLVMLFLIGYYQDRGIGRRHLWAGVSMALLGLVLLSIIIALGG